MGFFSGEKRVLSGEKKKKVSRIHLLPRLEAPAGKPQPGPQQGFSASVSLVILGWMSQGWVGEEEAVLFIVFAGSLVSTY